MTERVLEPAKEHSIFFAAADVGPSTQTETSNLVGRGFESLTATVRGTRPIERNVRSTPYASRRASFDLALIYSQSELREFLKISASGSADFGVGNASAKMDYYREHRAQDLTIILAVRVSTRTFKHELFRNLVTSRFSEVAATVSAQELYAQWGDSYVLEAFEGGELVILLRQDFATRFDLERFSHAIKGKYEIAKGQAEVSGSRELMSVFQRANLSILSTGVNPVPYEVVNFQPTRGAVIDIQRLLEVADRFGKRVYDDQVPATIGLRTAPLVESENWNHGWPSLDVDDALAEQERLLKVLDRASALSSDWRMIAVTPAIYLVPEDQLEALVNRANRCSAELTTIVDVIQHRLGVLARHPFDAETFDIPDVSSFDSKPTRKPVMLPIIRTVSYSIKRDPARGSGHAPNRVVNYEVNPNNLRAETHWFPNHSGGRLEIVEFNARLDPAPLGLDIVYRGRISDGSETPWTPGGTTLSCGHDRRLMAVAFKLTGVMADAYLIEYQGHAGNKRGDTASAGNTSDADLAPAAYVGRDWQLEGIRLAIVPKVWPV